ncbi:MAG: ferrous iron transporter B, partial [Candidatus Omnitrophica bacterium]|nr:ferrous iron transporter B [Candidatus Omnitrophota bacterium]
EIRTRYANHISYELALERQREVKNIVRKVVRTRKKKISFQEILSRITMNPVTGLPILFLVLYWGLYKFVGRFGAGTVVDFLEGSLFERHLNPFIIKAAEHIIPWPVLQDLFVGEYGMITLGFRYAVALILPIVTFFFIFFSIIEDTGYLPRLAMLIDRTFKKIGMSGRAVIPMVLGFGCATMATMVTRTLATKRERIIATILLSLAVPCSAQLGVMIALLSSRPKAIFLWAGIVGFIFLFVGFLTSRILPGERPSFYMEVPPLRLPKFSNIISKTYVRVKWYFKEVLPLFLLASFFIWAGKLTGLFDIIIRLLSGPVKLLGLPPEASKAFLFGFFRRDYGAAGLYDLNKEGMLNGAQLVVSCVTLTLFLPCIAQFLMNIKERGWKVGLAISVFVLFFSFSVGYIVNMVLTRLGVII